MFKWVLILQIGQHDYPVQIYLAPLISKFSKLHMDRIDSNARPNTAKLLSGQLFKIDMLQYIPSVDLRFDPMTHQILLILIANDKMSENFVNTQLLLLKHVWWFEKLRVKAHFMREFLTYRCDSIVGISYYIVMLDLI